MQQKLGMKILVIVGLVLLLLVPILMIKGLIEERADLHEQVQQEIARSSSGEQRVIGPFIYIQYQETSFVELITDDGPKPQINTYQQVIMPSELHWQSDLSTFEKLRGIYKATLYRSQNQITGTFDLSALKSLKDKKIKKLNLVMAIGDIRGIGVGSSIALNQHSAPLLSGTQIGVLPDGIHSQLDFEQLVNQNQLDFDINLALQGMRKLAIAPVGGENTVNMKADWPHPSFVGDYLPYSTEITDSDFSATWQTSYFATNMGELFSQCLGDGHCQRLEQRTLGVNLVDGVDHYLKSHRATNYAALVLFLVFSSFFLLEVLRANAIHPVQYGFVGLAIAVFYLLLVSLSEHIGFNLAYGVSALASSLLLSVYVAGMLKHTRGGMVFFAGLSFLYVLLFGLLAAEDYALLMGAILVFVVLSIIMLLTRKFNWYSVK